jgi:tetratricopeptide (TPR) repeat protein
MDDPGPTVRQWLTEGLSHQSRGNYPAALSAYRKVASRNPELVDAWCNMGSVLRELGRREEALQACERALVLDPDSTATLCNLGCLKAEAREFEAGLAHFQRVLALDPDHYLAHFQLGWVLFQLDRLEEALAADDRAIALNGTVSAAHLNRGYTLLKMGRLQEAEASLLRSLELDPGLTLAHWNLAFLRLLQGRYAEAWPDYAWRWKTREALPSQRHFQVPLWEGEAFQGRTLLVWAEQGFGDSIQFVRYLPLVKALGGQVVLQVQPSLASLMGTCPGADLVLGEQQSPPPFDLHVPILSLPQIFRSTLETLPRTVPYLACPPPPVYEPKPALVDALRAGSGRRIGVVWNGNPNQKDNRTRSLDPRLLEPLAALPGVSWYSLQKLAPGAERRSLPGTFQACDLDPFLETFADTAYALEHLHLLISVDTSVVHLAGALACPALVLLSYSPDWRWLMEGEECPWYPTFRLYRQPKPGDWAAVVDQLMGDLS